MVWLLWLCVLTADTEWVVLTTSRSHFDPLSAFSMTFLCPRPHTYQSSYPLDLGCFLQRILLVDMAFQVLVHRLHLKYRRYRVPVTKILRSWITRTYLLDWVSCRCGSYWVTVALWTRTSARQFSAPVHSWNCRQPAQTSHQYDCCWDGPWRRARCCSD